MRLEALQFSNFVPKLKRIKTKLKTLNKKEFWYISEKVKVAREALQDVHVWLARDPFERGLIEEEKCKAQESRRISWLEEKFMKQKSKVQWLKAKTKILNISLIT